MERDTNVLRARWLKSLKQTFVDVNQATDLKSLQRCDALERLSKALMARLGSLPVDDNGCVLYEVEYEHKDSSGRGRVFAIGESISISDDKYPRTANLQGMQKDLRVALVGGFENSEICLLCSQPCKSVWLHKIQSAHLVSEGDAKRLVNVIVSGGRYETWLKSVGKRQYASAIKSLCIKLYAEIGALRDQLLQHPTFKWTEVEREKLAKEGRPVGSIDRLLMPRIVQCCENWHDSPCLLPKSLVGTVRSNVFGGLIVKPGPNAHLAITEEGGDDAEKDRKKKKKKDKERKAEEDEVEEPATKKRSPRRHRRSHNIEPNIISSV
eukprot:scaffold3990_cov284-Chaetoceros_neogracile.AAC.6